MRKINGKLFLAMLVGAVALTGTVFGVHHFQYKRIAQALLFQARRAQENGKPREQARFTQRYLEFNPHDHDEKANLARLWASDGFPPRQRRQAISLLDEVLVYRDDPELRRLLVKTAIQLNLDLRVAREHLEKLLPQRELAPWIEADKALREKKAALPEDMAREDRGRGELEGYWGLIHEGDKKTAEALHCYRLAVRHAPEEQANYLRLAYLLRRDSDHLKKQKNADEADQVINELVRRNDSAHDAYLARWRYRRDFGLLALAESTGRIDLEAAAEDVAAAIKRKPESVDVLLAAADLERLRGRAAAEATARSVEDRRREQQEHRDRAVAHLKRGLEIVAKNGTATTEYGRFQLLWHKGNLLLDDLDVGRAQREEDNLPPIDSPKLKEEVAAVIELVGKSPPPGPAAAGYMNARLLMQDKKWANAARLFEQARALMNDQPQLTCQVNLYLGQCYEKLEEHAQMYAAFERVLKGDPNNVQAQIGQAQARYLQGQLDDAIREYGKVMTHKRVPPRGWIDIARLEMQKQLQSDRPDWQKVEAALKNARAVNAKANPKGVVDITLLEAEVLLRKGKPGDEEHTRNVARARTLLEKERTRDPKQPDVHAALVDLAMREGSAARARAALAEGRREAGDRAALRLAEARLIAFEQKKEANPKVVALAEEADKLTDDEQGKLLSGLADVLFYNGDLPRARSLWQRMGSLKSQQNNLRLRLLLFDLAMRDADEKGMRAVLDDIEAIEQQAGVYRRYGEALLLIWKARRTPGAKEKDDLLGRAVAELDRVKALRPRWAPVFIAQSEIAELKGMPSVAIREVKEAMAAGDNSPATIRRLVVLHANSGNEAEAAKLLDKLKKELVTQKEMAKFLVSIELKKNRSQALERLRSVVRPESDDPRDLLFLARALSRDGTAEEVANAEKLFNKAIQVAGNDPVPYVAKVQFLVEQKRHKSALDLIAELDRNVTAEKKALALGRCYDLVGRYKEANQCYEQALKAGKDDAETVQAVASAHLAAGRTLQAEPLLRKMAAGKMSNVSSAEVAWAQRSLALALAAGTDFQRFAEALTLVGLRLDEKGKLVGTGDREEPTESLRARARVLASQTQRQFRAEAIRLFESLRKQNALNPDDQFILSRLYEQQGEDNRSRDELKELVTKRDTRNPQYLAQYAMVLVAQKRDLAEAEKLIRLLEDLEKRRGVGPNGLASIDLKARLLEARGKGEEALELLQGHVEREGAQPEEVHFVLNSLARQGRFAEALELCERTWKKGKCQPEVIGAVSVQIVHSWDKATDAQVRKVEGHLKAALARKKDSAVLMMQLATLYDKRGQYDQATKQYQDILKVQPTNVVALNNLAWLLAMRSGDAHKALDHIEKAIAGMGRRADLLDTRALVHLAMKEPGKAIADLNEAVQDAPTPVRLFHLARAHHENRDQAKAREFLNKARDRRLDVSALHPIEHDEAKKLLSEYR